MRNEAASRKDGRAEERRDAITNGSIASGVLATSGASETYTKKGDTTDGSERAPTGENEGARGREDVSWKGRSGTNNQVGECREREKKMHHPAPAN